MEIINSWLAENEVFLAELKDKTMQKEIENRFQKCNHDSECLPKFRSYLASSNDPFEFIPEKESIAVDIPPLLKDGHLVETYKNIQFKSEPNRNSFDSIKYCSSNSLINPKSITDVPFLNDEHLVETNNNLQLPDLHNMKLTGKEDNPNRNSSNRISNKFNKKVYYYGDYFPSPILKNKVSKNISLTESNKKFKSSFDFKAKYMTNEKTKRIIGESFSDLNSLIGKVSQCKLDETIKIKKGLKSIEKMSFLKPIENSNFFALNSKTCSSKRSLKF